MHLAAAVPVVGGIVSVAVTAAVAVAIATAAVAVIMCIFVVGDVGVLLSTFVSLPVATEATSATTEVAR